MQQKLRRILANLYEEHVYILDSLNSVRKERFNLIRSESDYLCMEDTLMELSKHLRNYYDCKCIVLIDEYDHPLDVAFHHGFYNIARDIFGSLLGVLLKVSILDGCC